MHPLLAELNEPQRKAAETTDGPVLILAGAGSGKTKALTHRIAYLAAEKHVRPQSILAVTFTNKAAGEMRARVLKLLSLDPNNRGYFPFIGTFHSICLRLLRREATEIGLASNFLIFDAADTQSAIKRAMRQTNIDDKQFTPNLIHGLISSAKNELVDAAAYAKFATGKAQEAAAKVYPVYQATLQEAGALDFDDLIFRTVKMFKDYPEILKKYQNQFQYIMVDEYQDTNHAQYQITKLLAQGHHNICVVGDDWQCLVPGTLIETPAGPRKIEAITRGDLVTSASGYGRSGQFKVLAQKKFQYQGEIIHIETASGKELACTPNHLLFSRWSQTDAYFVYLMYSQDKGYRIGVAKGTRFDGKKHDTGLRIRANQERADRMWVIKVCVNRAEAMYNEALFAYKYGIPMLVFRAFSNRAMKFDQKYIDAIYEEIDTETRAKQLMTRLGLAFDYPHFVPSATTRNDIKRVVVNVVLFGDKRITRQSPWSASRISANTTVRHDIEVFEKLGHTVRIGRSGTFRAEIHNLDYGQIEQTLEQLKEGAANQLQIHKYAFLTDNKFSYMPASQIHLGMMVPTIQDGVITEDRIVAVSRSHYSGPVYDLDIDKVHNYIASELVVHNSIYSWRGANFQNILDFEKDYPDTEVIKLEQNYRSTKRILDAAHAIITKNRTRSDKKLWTDRGDGAGISIVNVYNEIQEAETIVRKIQELKLAETRELYDFAILYRTNAQSRSLEEAFLRANLPYKIVGGTRFYERKEIKDALAYLRFVYQPDDMVSFGRIINLPPRGLGDVSLQRLESWRRTQTIRANNGEERSGVEAQGGSSVPASVGSDTGSTEETDGVRWPADEPPEAQANKLRPMSLLEACRQADRAPGLQARAVNALQTFALLIDGLRQEAKTLAVGPLLSLIIKRSGYLAHLDDGSIQAADRIENVKELLSVAEAYNELPLQGFLEEIALISDIDNYSESTDAVTLMTLHAAKGLEFPVVFIPGAEEGIFPHSRALFDGEQMEEERRLCYVGMTRAKERLYMLYANSRLLYGSTNHNPPSRFLLEIPAELQADDNEWSAASRTAAAGHGAGAASWSPTAMRATGPTTEASAAAHREAMLGLSLAPGDRIHHAKFGDGIVSSISGDEVTAAFEGIGSKRLSLSFAPIEKVE
ncbi:MAG: ATP-dependent helicase PcrA [Patescibacteria group bacterium]|nr:ATP-dependent helicase PcrA [Patescibacteria group bacterium]